MQTHCYCSIPENDGVNIAFTEPALVRELLLHSGRFFVPFQNAAAGWLISYASAIIKIARQKQSIMKWILMAWLTITGFSFMEWQTDFETAKKIAKEKDRYILLNFSGSDWCIPCIRLRKEVFDSEEFLKLADSSLVLLNADFPRNKKNQLPKDAQRKNDELAERYNPSGQFPLTLILTPEGKPVRSWEGYPKNNAGSFINEIKSFCDAYHH